MNVKGMDSQRMSLAGLLRIGPLGLDEMSDVRQMHVSSFNAVGGSLYTESEVEAFRQHVYNNTYADRLFSAWTFLAWIDDHLVATCSWCQVGDDRVTARIADLFVDPLFARQGIGRFMLKHAEQAAIAAGYNLFVVRAGYHAIPAFEAAGYAMSSRGIYQLTEDVPLAVAFMRKSAAVSSGA